MFPNYQDGSRHFIHKLAYWSAKPQRGDVVGVQAPNGDTYIKRIIGLPGEQVVIKDGVVFVEGHPIEEPYFRARFPWQEEFNQEAGEYLVIGDNRAMISNKNKHGSGSREFIMGKLLY